VLVEVTSRQQDHRRHVLRVARQCVLQRRLGPRVKAEVARPPGLFEQGGTEARRGGRVGGLLLGLRLERGNCVVTAGSWLRLLRDGRRRPPCCQGGKQEDKRA
jgi:hypothetical protein